MIINISGTLAQSLEELECKLEDDDPEEEYDLLRLSRLLYDDELLLRRLFLWCFSSYLFCFLGSALDERLLLRFLFLLLSAFSSGTFAALVGSGLFSVSTFSSLRTYCSTSFGFFYSSLIGFISF